MLTRNRPVFLNLLQIHLPVTGWISIAHRITGVLLFLLLPLPLYLWQLSLEGPEGFQQVQAWFAGWPLRVSFLLFAWWFFHHFANGLRFLLLDLEVGASLRAARHSAIGVLIADILFLLGGLWWL